jgi:hypothetical protein
MQNGIKTMDCTPTWEALLPAIISLIESGGPNAKQVAKEELQKMARTADEYVKSLKGGNND